MRIKGDLISNLEKTKEAYIYSDTKDVPTLKRDLAIGIGLVVVGTAWLVTRSFAGGASAHNIGTFKAEREIGVIKALNEVPIK